MPVHPNSLSNLRPARRGEIRNPRGNNQYTADRVFRERFEAVCCALTECEDHALREALLRELAVAILDGALRGDWRLTRALCRHML